jgi:centrosomal protein CEP78
MINRIEYMMNELTRMMDSLENQNSATNHNLTAHLSSTMLG